MPDAQASAAPRAPRDWQRAKGIRARSSVLQAPSSPVCGRPAAWVQRAQALHHDNREALLSFQDYCDIAKARGMDMRLKTLGPFYRVQCREGDSNGVLLGTTNGFLVPPLGLMHCDTMQIFLRGRGGEEGDKQRGGVLGLGTLMAAAIFAYGYWSGCRTAEILAINDDDETHRKLTRYYARVFGFRAVREVGGNGLSDVPHQLVWGGVGTRMDGDLESLVSRCSKMFARSLADAREGQSRA